MVPAKRVYISVSRKFTFYKSVGTKNVFYFFKLVSKILDSGDALIPLYVWVYPNAYLNILIK